MKDRRSINSPRRHQDMRIRDPALRYSYLDARLTWVNPRSISIEPQPLSEVPESPIIDLLTESPGIQGDPMVDTAGDTNPGSPSECYTTTIPRVWECEVMQDLYHQQDYVLDSE